MFILMDYFYIKQKSDKYNIRKNNAFRKLIAAFIEKIYDAV